MLDPITLLPAIKRQSTPNPRQDTLNQMDHRQAVIPPLKGVKADPHRIF